jgi:hypothetical protein
MSSLYLGRSPLGFPRPLNFGLNWLSAHKAFIALKLSQTSTKLTFPVAGLQHLPQCQVICCPSNHFLPLKQSSWNLSKYLNLEKSQLKNFAGTGDWTQVCNSQSWLWCIYCWIALMQAWNSEIGSSRWGVKALSLEVPCQASWCRCQTYPTWAPRGRLPS